MTTHRKTKRGHLDRMHQIYETAKVTPETVVALEKDSWIGDFVFISLKRLTLGKGSQINPFASLTGGGHVEIGDYSVVGYGVRVISGTDTPEGKYMADEAPERDRKIVRGTVKIGKNCFIGANSVVSISVKNPHIRIGDGVVIGALSYVDESVPEGIVGWGIPFKAVKRRPSAKN